MCCARGKSMQVKSGQVKSSMHKMHARDMWDRLTVPMPTVTLESTFRQPICRFTVSRPPRSACRFTCVSALYRCACLRSLWDSPGLVVFGVVSSSEALRVVLRGFVNLPLFVQGQHYAVYLFFTTGGGGSVSLITVDAPCSTPSTPLLPMTPPPSPLCPRRCRRPLSLLLSPTVCLSRSHRRHTCVSRTRAHA